MIAACLFAAFQPRLGALLVTILALVAFVAACVFVATNNNPVVLDYGSSFYLTFGGLVLALIGSGLRLVFSAGARSRS